MLLFAAFRQLIGLEVTYNEYALFIINDYRGDRVFEY